MTKNKTKTKSVPPAEKKRENIFVRLIKWILDP